MSDTFRRVRPPGPAHQPSSVTLRERTLPETIFRLRDAAPDYQLDRDTELAVNMAIAVGAPLLVTGEPGTGKTQLAHFLAWYFGVVLYEFQVRSTSTAESIKYEFDAVGWLRASQLGADARRNDFLHPKALWNAYRDPNPSVVLVDEIDKAPRDFPNDLLQELFEHRFRHPFDEQDVVPLSTKPPVVVITSNAERRLPDAFLRRCIVHHIQLDEPLIARVVRARIKDFPRLSPELRDRAVRRFGELRERDLRKKPSLSELLVWLALLSARGVTEAELEGELADLPCRGALIKDPEDVERL